MFDHEPSQLPRLAAQEISLDRKAAATTAEQTRSAADEAMTAAARCGVMAHRSTRELGSDTPVVTALAAGHTALVAAQAAAEEATGAAADAADAAMVIEMELDSLPDQ
jgi:hypothetical protein